MISMIGLQVTGRERKVKNNSFFPSLNIPQVRTVFEKLGFLGTNINQYISYQSEKNLGLT
jgi:hypothetical protein